MRGFVVLFLLPFSHFGFFDESFFSVCEKVFVGANSKEESEKGNFEEERNVRAANIFWVRFLLHLLFLSRERRQFLPEKAKFEEKREQKEEEEEGSEKKVCMFLLI